MMDKITFLHMRVKSIISKIPRLGLHSHLTPFSILITLVFILFVCLIFSINHSINLKNRFANPEPILKEYQECRETRDQLDYKASSLSFKLETLKKKCDKSEEDAKKAKLVNLSQEGKDGSKISLESAEDTKNPGWYEYYLYKTVNDVKTKLVDVNLKELINIRTDEFYYDEKTKTLIFKNRAGTDEIFDYNTFCFFKVNLNNRNIEGHFVDSDITTIYCGLGGFPAGDSIVAYIPERNELITNSGYGDGGFWSVRYDSLKNMKRTSVYSAGMGEGANNGNFYIDTIYPYIYYLEDVDCEYPDKDKKVNDPNYFDYRKCVKSFSSLNLETSETRILKEFSVPIRFTYDNKIKESTDIDDTKQVRIDFVDDNNNVLHEFVLQDGKILKEQSQKF